MKSAFLLVLLLLQSIMQSKAAPPSPFNNESFELKIFFTNDMHARFEQTDGLGGTCREQDTANNRCYGGFARVAHLVRQERRLSLENGTPFLYLNAGDTYSGTPWFTLFTFDITTDFLNILKPDAITLGNHEFNNGIAELAPFINHADFPILVANLDFSNVPSLAHSDNIKKSTVFEWNGVRVGVIGYLTPDTVKLAKTEEVIFTDEIEAINKEAEILRDSGVNIIIGLGHSGINVDESVALNCPLIDLVIGGHTHTFLYTGEPPDSDNPMGPYPIVVQQNGGKRVPVYQAFAFTKYLGSLTLQFDSDGNLMSWEGEPILLDATIEEEEDVLQLLEKYRPGINDLQNAVVGRTLVYLDGQCRKVECNLGNLITDAMVHQYSLTYTDDGDSWTDASVAFLQGGSIRSSINASLQDGNITRFNLNSVLPFQNNLVIVEVSGQDIIDALERSVARYDNEPWGYGEFLQMSGINVQYNLSRPVGDRAVAVEILCALCLTPLYSPLIVAENYKIIISDYTYFGGDGYEMFEGKPYKIFDFNDIDVMENYLTQLSPVYPKIDDRIILLSAPDQPDQEVTTPKDEGGAANTLHLPATFLALISVVRLIENVLY